ncbi:hypothetical protein Ae201684_019211 [Aphanomyces euteiches]|uniref:Uncharacterized protein n=1 Tax=Aphanomyces euteiches TaxID=100861 RepID=A0A6G0W2W5_9STRA|nr:hypothetical protein Ae201684_019211 [Aphanomyces euteiches]
MGANSEFEAFFRAVQNNDVHLVKTLLDAGFDVNAQSTVQSTNRNGQYIIWKSSALMYAARYGQEDMVGLILAQDLVDVNTAQEKHGWTALLMAAANDHTNIVKLLLKRGDIDVNLKDCNGLSPLHDATKEDVNAKDNRDGSPLHTAVTHGRLDIVNLILGHGAINVSAKQKYIGSAFDIAASKGHIEILQLLLRYGRSDFRFLSENLGEMLKRASMNGHLNIVQLLLRDFATTIDLQPTALAIALHDATKNGHIDIVRLLLRQNRIDINFSNQFMGTALQSVAINGLLEIGQLILARDDVSSENVSIASHNAAGRGHIDILRLLLAYHGVNINFQNTEGKTALHFAAEKGFVEITRILLDHGINVNLVSEDFGTALHRELRESGNLQYIMRFMAISSYNR